MTGRLALYAIPTFAVAAMAFILLGPGRARPAIGARVRGSPVSGASVLALRVETVRRLHDIDDAAGGVAFAVHARAGDVDAPAVSATTGPDGIAEVLVPLRVAGPVDLALVKQGTSVPLALGRVAPMPAAATWAQLGSVPGTTTGDLQIRVDVVRGALAAPFPERVRVSVERTRDPVRDADLEIGVQGGETSVTQVRTDARGAATIAVKPLSHRVELVVKAKSSDATGTWEGSLPVRPGAIWLDPERSNGTQLALVSPAPRERAYVSLIGDTGRVGGVVVPLAVDAAGFHAGAVSLEPREGRWLHVVVAGDPYEQGAGTVAWPLAPPEGAVEAPRLALLLDGVVAAAALDGKRAGTARRTGIAIVSLAAALEIFLLVLHAKMSQSKLEKHLAGASTNQERAQVLAAAKDGTPAMLRTLSLIALVVMAFSIVGALAFVMR